MALTYDYDLAIVGGGVVGATLAVALRDSGLKIVVIEAESQSQAIEKGQAYVLHLSSSRIFADLGIWDQIVPDVEYFRQVRLSDANCPHVVEFHPQDLQAPVLGHVATHQVLLKALLDSLAFCDAVDWMCPTRVTCTQTDTHGVTIHLDTLGQAETPQALRVRLVVGADGARSQIREQAGIRTRGWPYWQSCIVATIEPEKFHNHTAYERFWPSGPFAILPVSKAHCRIVWTAPHAEAQALLALDDEAFAQALSKRYGSDMGSLRVVGPRFTFPAKLQHATCYVRPRLALVGDAAHSCHPVGGQGMNLGIRDAATLAEILITAQAQGEDIGSLKVMKRYQRWRRRQNFLSLSFTDILNRTFSTGWLPIVWTRRFGLRVISGVRPLKVLVLKFMAGLTGQFPSLT